MPFRVFTQSYRELRRPVRYWVLTMLGALGLVLLLYPLLDVFLDLDWLGMQSSASFLLGYQPEQVRLSRLGDWVNVVGFDLVFPLLAAGYAIGFGSWLGAGEEERGSLGLLLAAPLPRWRFMLEKSALLAVVLFLPVAALSLPLPLLALAGVTLADLGSRVLGLFLLAFLFGALALALGSFSGRRKLSQWASLGALILALIVSRLPLAAELRLVSPLALYSASSTRPGLLLLLLACGLVCLGVGWIGFERRDLAV